MEKNKKPVLEYIAANELVVFHNNPRKITPEEIALLRASILEDPEFLLSRPVLVNRTNGLNIIYAGTQRYRAMVQLGYEEIPCFVVENLRKDLFDYRMLLDNTHRGEWDLEEVKKEFDVIYKMSPEMSMDVRGFKSLSDVLNQDFIKDEEDSDPEKSNDQMWVYRVEFNNNNDLDTWYAFMEMLNTEYPNLPVCERVKARLKELYPEELSEND